MFVHMLFIPGVDCSRDGKRHHTYRVYLSRNRNNNVFAKSSVIHSVGFGYLPKHVRNIVNYVPVDVTN